MRIPARGWTSQFKKTAFSMTSTTERLQLICGLRRKDALEEERRKKLKTSFILPFLLFPAESALQQFSLSLASCPKVLSSFSPFFFLFSFFSFPLLSFFLLWISLAGTFLRPTIEVARLLNDGKPDSLPQICWSQRAGTDLRTSGQQIVKADRLWQFVGEIDV